MTGKTSKASGKPAPQSKTPPQAVVKPPAKPKAPAPPTPPSYSDEAPTLLLKQDFIDNKTKVDECYVQLINIPGMSSLSLTTYQLLIISTAAKTERIIKTHCVTGVLNLIAVRQ